MPIEQLSPPVAPTATPVSAGGRRTGLRAKLIVPLAVVQVAFLALGVGAVWRAAEHAQQQFDARIDRLAHSVAAARYPLTAPVLGQLRALTGSEFLLQDADGWSGTLSLGAIEPTALASLETSEPHRLTLDGDDYDCRVVRLPGSHPQMGRRLAILSPRRQRREAFWEAAAPMAAVAALGSLLASAAIWRVAAGLIRRIAAVQAGAARIAAGDPHPLDDRARDELGRLAAALNDLAATLAVQRRAIADGERDRVVARLASGFAHQLRNQAAGARLALELAGHSPDAEAVGVALRQLAALERQLRKFLVFARAEPEGDGPADVAAAVRAAVEVAQPRASHLGCRLEWTGPSVCPRVRVHPAMLELALDSLIGNAVDAAGATGSVIVRVEADARVSVIDTGPGPSPAIAARLGEPFVSDKPGGLGLGLALVRQLADRHGGQLDWQRDGERTRFTLRLPAEE